MKNLWKRFTTWLYHLRHPCTIITMDEAPAKGVGITFSYSGEYPVKTYKAGAKISEGRAVYVDKDGTVLPALSAEEQEHERELAWSQSMDWLTPQEERRIAIERWRNPFAKEDELQPKKQIDWPIGDHFEFGKVDTSMMYRFLEGDKDA